MLWRDGVTLLYLLQAGSDRKHRCPREQLLLQPASSAARVPLLLGLEAAALDFGNAICERAQF